MLRTVALIGTLLAALAVLPELLVAQTSTISGMSVVTAAGTGQIHLAPERATVSLSIETRAPSASAAGMQNATTTDRVLATLRRSGFGAEQVVTASYTLGENREYGRDGPVDRGYLATNTVNVNVRDFTKLASVIDSAIGSGATRVSNVRFTSSKADSARHAALKNAVADAERDAEAMAAAAGGRLGELLEVTSAAGTFGNRLSGNTDGGNTNYEFVASPPPSAPGTTIRVQEVTVSAGVLARWRFVH